LGRTDREINLCLQAYTRKVLDFGQSDRFDARWRLLKNLVFEQLEQENLIRVKMMRHLQHASAAGSANPEAYKHHFDAGVAELHGIVRMLFPWAPDDGDKAKEYREAWEQFFGIKVGSDEWKVLEDKIKLVDAALTKG